MGSEEHHLEDMFEAIVLYVSMIFAWDFSIGSWGSNKPTDPFLGGSGGSASRRGKALEAVMLVMGKKRRIGMNRLHPHNYDKYEWVTSPQL